MANHDRFQFLSLTQQQGSVSKADIQKYLKDNRIQVVEVVKGTDVMPSGVTEEGEFDYSGTTKHSKWQLEGQKENYKEVLVTMPEKPYYQNDVSYIKVNGVS